MQQTYDRFRKIIDIQNIFIVTNEHYAQLVAEQLPDVPQGRVLKEPIRRNTLPSVAWATTCISRLCPRANVIVSPADQLILEENNFDADVLKGLDFVGRSDCLLTMGVKPTRPDTGYGYIQAHEEMEDGIFAKVKSFTEKPALEFARMFMESGEFYWNTGLFLANVLYLREALKKIFPPVLRNFEKGEGGAYSVEAELEFIKENFPAYPNLSIDYGILDKNENVYVMKCDFGWADLGMWHSIYESMSKGDGDNVVIGSKVIAEDSRNNIIKLPDDHLGIINGLDGYIVAEKGNVLLICRKEDSSALIRKYVNEVQVKYGEEFI